MAATKTRETRLARAERLAQGPIKVRWDRVASLALALATMLCTGALFFWMLTMWADGRAL